MSVPPLPKKAPKSFKTNIEPWMIAVVEKAVKEGLPLQLVGGLIGVTRATLTRWRELGNTEGCPDPLLVDFALTVEKARAEAAQAGITNLQAHAMVDWKAQLELLKAADPETWSTSSKLKIEATVTAAPQRNLAALSNEELEQLAGLENKLLLTSGQ